MLEVLKAIGDRILNNGVNNDINNLQKTQDQVMIELRKMRAVDKTLKMLSGRDYDDDPIVRAKNIAKGLYDKYVGDWDLFLDYKDLCKILVNKFGL